MLPSRPAASGIRGPVIRNGPGRLYRVTFLSNYSPKIAPEGHTLFLTETSYSDHKHEDKASIVDRLHRDFGCLGALDQLAHAAIAPRRFDVKRLHALRMVSQAGSDRVETDQMSSGFHDHKSRRFCNGRQYDAFGRHRRGSV